MNDAAQRTIERIPEGHAASAGPGDGASPARPPPRGRLFRKYLVLILSLVGGALLVSGAISLYFTYQENKAALAALQQEKAVAAAARIDQYVRQIEQQLANASLPQLDASDLELRRIEFLKLLRQAPEVTDIAQIDAQGREQIYVSRLGMDVIGSGKDRSQEPAFASAKRGKPWYGPVYFRKETEPYMTIALRSSDTGPVTVADLNLKFIWDVVSRIKVGEKGKAYVVDASGYLVADPDIGLVLRKTSLSSLPHVKAALGPAEPAEPATVSVDLAGTPVLTAVAPIAPLGWEVFVEQPVSEVYARLDASILRTGALLLAGLAIAAVCALVLARGMARPIRTLQEGAARIGAGDLDQAIEVRTGDELESLAHSFNQMSSRLRESYASLERKVEERTRELSNALDQQTAISEILRVISASPTDVQPVLEAVAERAAHLCEAPHARVMLVNGNFLTPVAMYTDPAHPVVFQGGPVPLDRSSISGRAVVDRTTVHVADVVPLATTEFAGARENIDRMGIRAVLSVPLMRDAGAYGAIFLFRREPRPFSPAQIALVQTFARQAAIAIDNVRLFNQTREALEQQTATAEVLQVISSSVADTTPVFEKILDSCQRIFATGEIGVFLVGDDGKVHAPAWRGQAVEHVVSTFPRPLDETVTATVVRERRTLQIPDAAAMPDAAGTVRSIVGRIGNFSAAWAPMLWEGQGVGSICVLRQPPSPLSPKQLALLETFARQAAIAIQNARLFNETREALDQQRASGEVLSAISSSIADTTPVFERIMTSCERLFSGRVIAIERVDESGTICIESFRGPEPVHDQRVVGPVAPDASISANAILSRAVVHVPDLAADPTVPAKSRAAYAEVGVRAVIVAPMLWEGRGIGVISVGRGHAGPFSEKEIALLRTFADQAVIAIQNARLFREIEEKGRQLEIANKHKSEFLANMSHELRTPLNAIIGFSEVLLERYFGEVNEKQEDYLRDIHASGKHLLGLINDILDLAKIEAGRMELDRSTFDLPSTLANALTLVRERAQRHGIALGLDVDPAVGEITADERKVKQVVINLLTNAVKFTPDGGRVDLIARREPGRVDVAVRDTGIGIAPQDHAAVFEEFRQVGGDYTRKQEGTGLGLALVKRFVELHGGRIRLDSEPGKGSTFTFDIPQ